MPDLRRLLQQCQLRLQELSLTAQQLQQQVQVKLAAACLLIKPAVPALDVVIRALKDGPRRGRPHRRLNPRGLHVLAQLLLCCRRRLTLQSTECVVIVFGRKRHKLTAICVQPLLADDYLLVKRHIHYIASRLLCVRP